MPHLLVATDKFKGSMSASEVADAVTAPDDGRALLEQLGRRIAVDHLSG